MEHQPQSLFENQNEHGQSGGGSTNRALLLGFYLGYSDLEGIKCA